MSNRLRKLLQPQYVGKFQCLGPACEDSCCIGWRVQIDKETYQRYRECPDKELREQMDEKVTRHRTNANDATYAKIKLNSDGQCPFIDTDKLCAIQRKFGEEYLSVTCTSYPRIVNTVNGITERSLTMSCPEAVRLALLNPDLMSFDESEEDTTLRNSSIKIIDTYHMKEAYMPHHYFWELRIFIISLLQNRSYTLWQRLVILGLFCQALNQLASEAKVHEIPQLIGTYLNHLDADVFKDQLETIPNELTIQMELMKEVADERIFAGANNNRFMENFIEFMQGIHHTAESKTEEIGQRYAEAYDKYYQPFMADHEYILENYLVNYVFKNLFPFGDQKHIFDNYVMLIVHYALIKMLLIGIAGFQQENFSAEHVVKLIQSFSKTVEHNKAYLKRVFELLKANQFNTMPYMAILIKN